MARFSLGLDDTWEDVTGSIKSLLRSGLLGGSGFELSRERLAEDFSSSEKSSEKFELM
jgi:hypothetical protein